ncbi:hypothetical protein Ahy_B04g073625 isoform G [Arachis hypogaea]|uniref:Uncharacterized protein n=1 Tax=Arachis hypogaea TaxID=3818 RepID=A0A444ZQX3_ARAHY|nr:hypothetical protein Ahy_B04g073625 isoform G [Arachis hypogaea]
MVLISSPNPACTGTHKIIAEYIKTRDFPFCMWWKTGSVWIWLRHQKQSKTLSGPVSDPSKLGTIMVLALVKLLLKIVICDAYTPAGEPIPTNKRHNAAKIFSHPYEITAESFEPSLFFSHHIPVPSDRMKRKRGHKKGKGKSSSKHVVSETSALEDFGTNNDNDDDKDDNSGMEVDTPSSTGTDQQHYNVASINPDGSIDKTVGKPLEVGCFKVKLKTPKMLESHSQHTSSDAPTHSDPDKSSQQHGFDKQGVGADRKEDRVEDAALSGDGKVAKGGQAKQKSKKRHEWSREPWSKVKAIKGVANFSLTTKELLTLVFKLATPSSLQHHHLLHFSYKVSSWQLLPILNNKGVGNLILQLHTFFFYSHKFIDRITLYTGGANFSVEAGFGGLYRCRDPPCQCCPDSMANTNLIPNKWTSLVWLVSVVSNSVFHPLFSYYSNTYKLGWRHRSFMFAGAVGATIAFLTIGFAKGIGYAFGDNISKYTQHRAFIFLGSDYGSWRFRSNMIMPAAETSWMILPIETNQRSDWHIIGNELGYLAALFSRFDVMLAFTVTKAFERLCANVKSISIFSILLLRLLSTVALFCVQNKPALLEEESSEWEEEDDRCALVKCF